MSLPPVPPELSLDAVASYVDALLDAHAEDIYRTVVAHVEKQVIEQTLAFCKGNKSRTSQRLGLSRMTLRTKINAYAESSDQTESIGLRERQA